jgi:arsenite methyltransferase
MRRVDDGQRAAAAAFEPAPIAGGIFDVRHRVSRVLHDPFHHRIDIGEAVVHPGGVASRLDQTRAPQIRKVSRSGRLRQTKGVVDLAHADLALDEQRQNAQPRGIGQCLICRRYSLEVRRHPFSYIRLDEYTIAIVYSPKRIFKECVVTDIKHVVQAKYGEAARQARAGQPANCGCSSSCCDSITSNLYDADQTSVLPAEAVLASLGCGNPTALAELKPGEVVLDLGSGGGIDVLLSAKRVGPTGKAYGLDMTDEMLALARENQAKSGLTNVEFLRGEIEHIPLPDNSVDVIISNCVINLSADKDQVLAEAFRVLKPGGRFAVSDVVIRGDDVPEELRRSMELWVGCVAGALEEGSYRDKLASAGFEGVELEPTRVYRAEDARQFLTGSGFESDEVVEQVDGKFMSAFVRATKPNRSCCETTCCSA